MLILGDKYMNSHSKAPGDVSEKELAGNIKCITILTPENIEIRYRIAGLGTRFLAWAFDTLLQLIIISVFSTLLFVAGMIASFSVMGAEAVSLWVLALMTLITFFITNAYFIFFEVRWNGQTPGKRLLYIRAIHAGGYPVSFQDSLVRNFMRIIDMLPLLYGVGISSILLSSGGRRLGDLAAGTYVIMEEPPAAPLKAPEKKFTVPEAKNLSEAQLDMIYQFLLRTKYLGHKHRITLAERMARYFSNCLQIQIPPNRTSEGYLHDLLSSARGES